MNKDLSYYESQILENCYIQVDPQIVQLSLSLSIFRPD
jgi:hypothetical protein